MINKIVRTILTLFLLTASMGYGANMQVTSSAVPLSGGTITPNGIKYSSTFINYSVASKPGWSLSSVQIDGVEAASGQIIVPLVRYQVPFDTSKAHTIKANFTQTLYSISTTAGAGGTILVTGGGNINITPGSARGVVIAPATGYKIASLTVDGTLVTPADPTVAFTQSYSNIQGNKTVSATFALIPTATAYAGYNMTVEVNVPTVLTGSVSANSTPSAYLWQIGTGPAGATITNNTTLTPTFNATTQGTYTVTLTATVGGIDFLSAPATITVKSATMLASNNCTTCHAGQSQVTGWLASIHATAPGGASCLSCHMPNNETHPGQPTATMINICQSCHTDSPQGHPIEIGGNPCVTCHNPHSTVASCNSCHDSPPATASHLKHYGSAEVGARYGDLRITQAFSNYSSGYVFGCGNCHPMDASKHRNGVVDVELYNPLASAGSLKALNPVSAAYVAGPEVFTDNKGIPYTKGTCSNVYCHSYNDWTTTEAIPDSDPNWQTKVVTTRIYRTVTWGSTPLGCSGCHGNPTQTSSPTNDGGAGDSHSWIDSYGNQNLHTFNMGYAPVSCRYCHNDTVKQLNTYTVDSMGVRTLSEVPISNFSKHVNGSNDVAFDTQNSFVYSSGYSGNVSKSLANATYDRVTKNCSNVSCHDQQTTVTWGTPYRWWYNECNVCHGY